VSTDNETTCVRACVRIINRQESRGFDTGKRRTWKTWRDSAGRHDIGTSARKVVRGGIACVSPVIAVFQPRFSCSPLAAIVSQPAFSRVSLYTGRTTELISNSKRIVLLAYNSLLGESASDTFASLVFGRSISPRRVFP